MRLLICCLLSAAAVSACATEETPQPEAQPVVEQQQEPEPQPQPAPEPQSDPQPEAQPEPERQSLQQSVPKQQTAEFLGDSFAEIDRFSGSTTVAIAAVGDGAFPFDGLLLLWCSDGSGSLILGDIPYVTDDMRTALLQWVTPSVYGDPQEVRGTFFDSDGGDRNWRARNLRPEWFQTSVTDLQSDARASASLIAHLVEDGEISVRIPTYGEVFSATFAFGDMTQAEHWPDFLDCLSQ